MCGMCGTSFMLCQCQGVTHGCNYIHVGLPPPARGTGKSQLIRRWCSIVSSSATMGQFDADSWYEDNAENLTRSMAQRKELLEALVEDYVASFPNDPTLSSLAQAVGGAALKSKPPTDQVKNVSAEARAALLIFQSGDWSCLTWVGSILLQNAFQASDPAKYRLDDVHLKLVFDCGIGLLNSVMGRGFDANGWQLAMEIDRAPVGTSVGLRSAQDRLLAA